MDTGACPGSRIGSGTGADPGFAGVTALVTFYESINFVNFGDLVIRICFGFSLLTRPAVGRGKFPKPIPVIGRQLIRQKAPFPIAPGRGWDIHPGLPSQA